MNLAPSEKHSSVISTAKRFALPTETAFLSQAVLLEEAGPPRAPAMACLLGFVFVIIAVLAGILIEIDVVTSSQGQITTAGGHHLLQSFDGGIVDEVLVEEGQIVHQGEIILTLNDPEARAQLDRLTVREAALSAQIQRLRSLADLAPALPRDRYDEAMLVVNEQMSILPIEQQAMIAERSLAQAEIDRRSKTVRKLRALEDEAKRRVTLTEDNRTTERHLYDKRLSTKGRLLEAEQNAIDANERLGEIQGQIREAEASLLEARRRLENVIADRKLDQGDQLSTLMIDVNETRQQIKAMRQRLNRATTKAPVRAIVLDLKARHAGQTIAPGDPIVEIIPIDQGLIAEVHLPPSEISHVHPGHTARLAIDGLEPHRHGYLEGTVESISPSTFVDEDSLPYYRASIALASDQLDGIVLVPGMTLQAQIKTGARTIMEYLLKPVYRAWSTAFRER